EVMSDRSTLADRNYMVSMRIGDPEKSGLCKATLQSIQLTQSSTRPTPNYCPAVVSAAPITGRADRALLKSADAFAPSVAHSRRGRRLPRLPAFCMPGT